jgi:NAD(P)-dependent dehydrogenase (short-subunit alcohol dehydrogenase family)
VTARPVALITGAGGGLGGAIARALATKGFDLVLNDLRDTASFAQLREDIGSAHLVIQDIGAVDELEAFVERVHAIHRRLDCLVNNAAVSVLSRGDILDVTPESFDRCQAINLRAQFFLTQRVARRMLRDPRLDKRRRSIVTITSVAVEHVVGKVLAEYSISKAGLSHMVKHFATRLVTEGIDCYEVRPGMMKSDMTASSREKYDGLIEAGFVPAHRWGELAEVGRVVANLADGALSYAVGQTLNIDGGMSLKTF